MKRYGKGAQFFILAAVIISAVVISLGVTTNKAVINNDPETFEDFTYEIKKETGAVMDYEIYSGFADGENLTAFIDLLAGDIRDRDAGANFLFIYGDDTGVTIRNYGANDAYIHGAEVPGGGANVISNICYGANCQTVEEYIDDSRSYEVILDADDLEDGVVNGTAFGVDFNFDVGANRQVIFLIQKGVEDENYVSVR